MFFFKTFWCVLYSRGSYIWERLIIERIRYAIWLYLSQTRWILHKTPIAPVLTTPLSCITWKWEMLELETKVMGKLREKFTDNVDILSRSILLQTQSSITKKAALKATTTLSFWKSVIYLWQFYYVKHDPEDMVKLKRAAIPLTRCFRIKMSQRAEIVLN